MRFYAGVWKRFVNDSAGAGMIRFLQQFENGNGAYARERHAWVDRMSLEDLRALAGTKPAKRNRRPR